ncbi:DNA recombination protein RmuC [Candidatus Microgenomates bacterium]|jgi:DNA recombination protein RmuC|nr:MAG: DNA recombination protein RmuC [Candidatus Microgenomates bacterium]
MAREFVLISAVLVLGFLAIIFFLNRKLSSKADSALLEWLKTMQLSLDSSNKNINETLQKSSFELNRRLDLASQLMGQIQKEAGKFSELSLSMKNLQDYLRSPKLRGNIGEQVLKDLISQMFPKNSFFLQYAFKSGNRVDAAIKTDAGILPIDSKFPAENFQRMMIAESEAEKESSKKDFVRDIKKHIADISQKYILPEEGTMDFALMYIPSEPVYYEVINDSGLMDFARKERVYPVSPNTLYAHLQVLLLSFEGKEIEKKSRKLFSLIRGIQKDYSKLSENLSVLNKHITNSYNQMANVNNEFMQIGQKLTFTQALEEEEKIEKIEIFSRSAEESS